MKWRDMLKEVVIGIFIAVMALSLGQCTRSARAMEVSDWKQCNTKLIMANTTDTAYYYNVVWLDHDILKYKGRPVPRAGGEVGPQGISETSKSFRLCPGRHAVFWSTRDATVKPFLQKFTVTPNISCIVLTPEKVFKKYNTFYKLPKMKNVSFTTGDNVSDIYQVFRDCFSDFAKVAKTLQYGKTVLIHTGLGVGTTFYTMSLHLTSDGILLSIDFTKQVTLSETRVDIYYEGIRPANGNKYYCYAKKLHRDQNYDQTPIPAESVFKQVVKVLFEDRKEV